MSRASRARARRAKDVRKAHRQGFTFGGFKFKEAGGPEALAERSQRGLQKQAQREVKSSYAPLDSELTRREEKVKALDAKRAGDEAVYKDWLVQQQGIIRSTAQENIAKLQGQQAQQRADLQKRLHDAGQFARAAGIDPNQQAGVGEAHAAAQTAQSQGESNVSAIQGLGTSQLAATQSNSLAFTAQQAAKRQADTLEQLAEVSDLRTKTALQQAADQQKRIAELLEGEVQKAQIRIAGAQFSVKERNDAAKDAQDTRDKRVQRGLDRDKLDLDLTKAEETERHNLASEAQARKKARGTAKKGVEEAKIERERIAMVRSISEEFRRRFGSFKNFQKLRKKKPALMIKRLEKLKAGNSANAWAIIVAHDLWRYGKLRGGAKQRLRELDIPIPEGW